MAQNCGVEFFNFGSILFSKRQAMFIRFCFYQKFLIHNHNKFDRVIFCDLYDTIFQHDPFTKDFGSSFYITSDIFSFKVSKKFTSNYKWLKECFKLFEANYDPTVSPLFSKKFKKKVVNNPALNGGLQAGKILIINEFATAMMKIGNPTIKVTSRASSTA